MFLVVMRCVIIKSGIFVLSLSDSFYSIVCRAGSVWSARLDTHILIHFPLWKIHPLLSHLYVPKFFKAQMFNQMLGS